MNPETQSGFEPPQQADIAPAERAVEASANTNMIRSSRLTALGPWAVPALFVVIFVVFSIATPSTFATLANVKVMINGQAIILMLALAILIPLRCGDFDLSVSAVMVLVGCTAASLSAHGFSTFTACLIAFIIGPAVGIINGILVVRIGVNSFIATLGMLTVLDGLSALISGSNLMTTVPAGLTQLMGRSVGGLTLPVLLGWVIALLVYYVWEWTPMGRYMLFMGNNLTAARLAGIRVSAYRQGTYLVSAIFGAIAGLLLAGSLGSVDPSSSGAYLLPPFTAAFLGASAIKLGRFNVAGTLVAIYLVAEGVQGLELLGASDWVADVFNGTFLIFAVSLAILLRRKSSK